MSLRTKSHNSRWKATPWSALSVFLFMVSLLGKGSEIKATGILTGSVSPERLCVCPGDEATFTCSVKEPDGQFTWITSTTTETCTVFSSMPQSQCGQFIGQLQNSSVSTLTATSSATNDTGNILIQCYYITELIGSSTLLIAGIPPTPILHDVNSGDIRDNGDGDTHNVTLRWTLSEPDDCVDTIHFNVTPDSSTHCGSCEVGPGDPGMQEEFSCQVVQGIGQNCTYIVYAVRCGDTQNGTMSEPVEENLTGSPSSTVPNTPQLQVSPSSTVSNNPHVSPSSTLMSNTTQVPQEFQDTECDFCWYYILLVTVSVLLLVIATVVSVVGCIGLRRRRTKINKAASQENTLGANRELRYSMILSPSPSSESAIPDIGVELSSCTGHYEDPDELLSRDNSQTGKPGTSQPQEPAIEEYNPVDINIEYKPEDHLPTYADPKDIKRETTEKTGEEYALVDMSKKKKRRQPPAVKKGAYADPKDIRRGTTEKTGEEYALVDISKKKKRRQPPAVKQQGSSYTPHKNEHPPPQKKGDMWKTASTLV